MFLNLIGFWVEFGRIMNIEVIEMRRFLLSPSNNFGFSCQKRRIELMDGVVGRLGIGDMIEEMQYIWVG